MLLQIAVRSTPTKFYRNINYFILTKKIDTFFIYVCLILSKHLISLGGTETKLYSKTHWILLFSIWNTVIYYSLHDQGADNLRQKHIYQNDEFQTN